MKTLNWFRLFFSNFLFYALFFLLICSSCELIAPLWTGKETVKIQLPSTHPLYGLAFPDKIPSYTIRWYDREGRKIERSGISENVSVEMDSGFTTPVLLFPETGVEGLPPAGGIYPYHADADGNSVILKTNWLRGVDASYAEEICLKAAGGYESGRMIVSHFNWNRFDAEIAVLDDPLRLDRERFLSAVLSGKMTMYDIEEEVRAQVALPLKTGVIGDKTAFIPSWPGKSGFVWTEGETVTIEASDGLSRYFCPYGFINIQIESGIAVSCFFSHYRLQD